jgi:hypothetical protein
MKYNGRKLAGPRIKIEPVIRTEEEGGNMYFRIQAITDFQPFLDLCPQPQAPEILLPGNRKKYDINNAGYKATINEWFKKRAAWIAIKALEPTTELTWETVDLNNPDTWQNYHNELRESGLADLEMTRILNTIMDLNGLNENLIEEARQSFLTGQQTQLNGQSSHQEEAKSI